MSDISQHYGGSLLAMIGKSSVAFLSDKRLGSGPISVSKNFTKIYSLTPRLFFGFTGLVSDGEMLFKKIRKNYNLFVQDNNKDMEPSELSNMISYILYQKRLQPYYVAVIVCGMTLDKKPYASSMDCIGAMKETSEFVTSGTASKNLMGLSEALFYPEMEDEDLFTTSVQTFLNSSDRDTFGGMGFECLLINPEGYKRREFVGRCD
ncbi:proteasome subunit PSB3 (PSB3) [Vairimorpha necatrix]|uniref:Proteasome subunit PSB3 (PSB3) n=1 Tax=Vairimorpha necatrix TaxID=6039 RepID=A0AAX4JCZ2_9MICR|nr:Chain I, Proteasome subunit beta type-3 [Vairimorpha necatrix]8ADN_W Chain W, Proteasome subunit beta type-3 [Vairimorpha necatrix]